MNAMLTDSDLEKIVGGYQTSTHKNIIQRAEESVFRAEIFVAKLQEALGLGGTYRDRPE